MEIRQLKKIKGRLEGAASGTFNPGKEAAEILKGADYSTLFAYLFRRFGMPNFGWDDHKELTQYILTTKIKGVYLSVSPKPSGLQFTFGYLLSDDVNKKCWEEQGEPWRKWKAEYQAWVKDNNKEFVLDYLGRDFTKEEMKLAYENWNKTHPEWDGKDGGEEEADLFWKYQGQRTRELQGEYSLINPFPKYKFSMELGREEFEKDSFREEVNNALIETIKDLLRPVYVRDVPINACGLFDEGSKENKKLRSVKYHKEAGFGLLHFVEENQNKAA